MVIFTKIVCIAQLYPFENVKKKEKINKLTHGIEEKQSYLMEHLLVAWLALIHDSSIAISVWMS